MPLCITIYRCLRRSCPLCIGRQYDSPRRHSCGARATAPTFLQQQRPPSRYASATHSSGMPPTPRCSPPSCAWNHLQRRTGQGSTQSRPSGLCTSSKPPKRLSCTESSWEPRRLWRHSSASLSGPTHRRCSSDGIGSNPLPDFLWQAHLLMLQARRAVAQAKHCHESEKARSQTLLEAYAAALSCHPPPSGSGCNRCLTDGMPFVKHGNHLHAASSSTDLCATAAGATSWPPSQNLPCKS